MKIKVLHGHQELTMLEPECHAVCRRMAALGSKQLVTESEHGWSRNQNMARHSLTAGFQFHLFLSLAVWPWATVPPFLFALPVLLPTLLPTLFFPWENWSLCKMCAQVWHWVQPVGNAGLQRTGREQVQIFILLLAHCSRVCLSWLSLLKSFYLRFSLVIAPPQLF